MDVAFLIDISAFTFRFSFTTLPSQWTYIRHLVEMSLLKKEFQGSWHYPDVFSWAQVQGSLAMTKSKMLKSFQLELEEGLPQAFVKAHSCLAGLMGKHGRTVR